MKAREKKETMYLSQTLIFPVLAGFLSKSTLTLFSSMAFLRPVCALAPLQEDNRML